MEISGPQAGKAIGYRGQNFKGHSCGNSEKGNSVRNMDTGSLAQELSKGSKDFVENWATCVIFWLRIYVPLSAWS